MNENNETYLFNITYTDADGNNTVTVKWKLKIGKGSFSDKTSDTTGDGDLTIVYSKSNSLIGTWIFPD